MAARVPHAGMDELELEPVGQGGAGRSGPAPQDEVAGAAAGTVARQKSLTIGAVCKALVQEFPDISISKIRYLEDQKLLTPRRTPGGYRLYTQGDVARLRTILRMQRDEFLPLRVIRQELAAGRAGESTLDLDQDPARTRSSGEGMRPRRTSVSARWSISDRSTGALYSLDDVL
jgi:DNA-binding transcriptional MerR regulator